MNKVRVIAPVAKPPKAPKSSSRARRRNDVRIQTRPPARLRSDFDRWIDLGVDLARYCDQLIEAVERLNDEASPAALFEAEMLLARWPEDELGRAVAKFLQGRDWFERTELYDQEPSGLGLVISAKFVGERIAGMLAAFPAGAPANAQAYVRLLIAEVIATGASATQIEWATRKLAREQTFLPALSEVLKALRAAVTPEWDDAFREDEGTVMLVWARGALERVIAHEMAGGAL